MAKFCSNCGKPVNADEKFCKECGCPVKQAAPSKPICPHCGKEMKLTSKFCPHCGKNPAEPKAAVQASVSVTPNTQTVHPAPMVTGAVQTVQTAVAKLPEIADSVQASAGTGTMTLDIPDFSGAIGSVNGMSAGATQILSPIRTIFSSILGFFRNIKATFKDKKALIGALIMSAVWIVLWLWNRSGLSNSASAFLSALTFAEGGTRGDFGQVLGGIFGKGLVISGFVSLFDGGFREMFSGVKRLFGKGLNIGWALFGLGAAALCYHLFAGYAGTYGIMVAVSGAVLSLQALGGSSGFFGRLAKSVVSKKLNGVRTADETRVKGLLTGTAAGFAVSACLSALSVPWWAGLIIMAAGIALDVVLGRKAVES